jgi:vancomycin resistance protein YoaR
VSTTLSQNDVQAGRRSDRRTLLFIAIALAAVPVVVYLAGLAVAWGKVPRSTYVAGVDIGGKSAADAKRTLTAALAPRAKAPIPVRSGDFSANVAPAAAGLRLDINRTVDGLVADSINPVTVARAFFGGSKRAPEVTVDSKALDRQVVALAGRIDAVKQEGSVTFEGTSIVPVRAQVGRALDRAAAAKSLRHRFAELSAAPFELPVAVTPVTTTQARVDAAVKVATSAISAPLQLTADDRSVDVPVETIAKLVSFKAGPDGALQLVASKEQIDALLLPQLKSFDAPAKDVVFSVSGGVVRMSPSANGRSADATALATALPAAVSKDSRRDLAIPFTETEPKLTTDKAKTLGIKQVIGSFTTHHPCCKPRVNNIHTIADIVDGAVILPGETFSLNAYVGERDKGRGFVEAPMIMDGKLQPAVGGGVSQFATTMFNAVFFSGLKNVEHKPHSFYISRYPAGREATVSHPAPDLKWTNDSGAGVLVQTSYTGTSVTVTFYGTKVYDEVRSVSGPRTRPIAPQVVYLPPGPKCISTSGGVGGFDITVFREFYKDGVQVRPRERFFTRYNPEHHFICGVDPATAAPGTVPPGTTPPAGTPTAPPAGISTPPATTPAKPTAVPTG